MCSEEVGQIEEVATLYQEGRRPGGEVTELRRRSPATGDSSQPGKRRELKWEYNNVAKCNEDRESRMKSKREVRDTEGEMQEASRNAR